MKQKMPKKVGTIKPNQDDEKSSPTKSSEGQSDGEQKSKKEQKEADLVERIALDLDQLDLDETVEKVKQVKKFIDLLKVFFFRKCYAFFKSPK